MGMLRTLPERAAVSLISAFPSWTATWKPQLKRSRKPAANYWSEANTHPALLTLMLPIQTDTSSSWVSIEKATKRHSGAKPQPKYFPPRLLAEEGWTRRAQRRRAGVVRPAHSRIFAELTT